MGKKLIITEKPSVAFDFARVLKVDSKSGGRRDGFIENDEYVISWCYGHLVSMVYPEEYDIKYKNWRLEDLPFLPQDYKYGIVETAKDQYYVVNRLLHRDDIDLVLWAGDSGKEGQTIEENIRMYGGVRDGMEERRVWIDSQTDEEILRGIREAKPMSDYALLGQSGIMRTIEDYALGINFSRALSVKYARLLNNAAATGNYTAIAVGRVMTCVLGMVVEREREIRNFTETPFYRVVGSFTEAGVEAEWKAVEGSKYFESPKLYKENGFKTEESANELIASLQGKQAMVEQISQSTSKKKAPLLYNLAELQADCAKRFKISPDQTLACAQSLYESKMTTYPRTDARVLSSAVAKEISKNIRPLAGYADMKPYVDAILKNGWDKGVVKSQYTDDSKVTDHYAIIPTGNMNAYSKLTSLEKQVYDMIVRRFLSIFCPPAEYENVKMTVEVDGERFFASAKVLVKEGYLKIANPGRKNDAREGQGNGDSGGNSDNDQEDGGVADPKVLMELAKSLKKGDVIPVAGYQIKQGKTSPPKRYTSGSMVLAMENAGQLIEDEELRAQIKGSGIGTSATRAEIIAKLVRIKYLNLNQKTQVLTPENLGEMVYETVRMTVPAMLNPRMTASWEKGLEDITQGTVAFADYRAKLEDYIRRETLNMVGNDITQPLTAAVSNLAAKGATGFRKNLGIKCPWCKEGDVVTTPFGYGCSRYEKDKSGCNFIIGQIAGIDLDEEDVKQLITEGHTRVINGFKSKAGKRFSAALKMEPNEQGQLRASFDFSDNGGEPVEGLKCPICGGNILKTGYGFKCEHNDRENPESCRFSIGQVAGKTISLADVTKLINEGHTDTIRGFKSKAGKRFDAVLALRKDEEGRLGVVFDFDSVEEELLPEDVICPACGGRMKKTSFGYGCVNFNGDAEGSCRFSIGQIAGKKLTAANVKQLLTEGKTETLRGFKGKSGKRFDSCLVLGKDENGKPVINFDFENVEPLTLKDVACPKCGGKIQVTSYGYVCENHKQGDEESCPFFVGKIASVMLKQNQMIQLLTDKKTDMIEGFVAKTGMKFSAGLKLTDEGRVAFDFPEREAPEESTVACPKCNRKLMRDSRTYTCECGYRLWRTIAGVTLPDEIVTELLTTGRTKARVTGFTSKAGNTFDTCLKYEEDSIRFDFDAVPEETSEAVSELATEAAAGSEVQGPAEDTAGDDAQMLKNSEEQ